MTEPKSRILTIILPILGSFGIVLIAWLFFLSACKRRGQLGRTKAALAHDAAEREAEEVRQRARAAMEQPDDLKRISSEDNVRQLSRQDLDNLVREKSGCLQRQRTRQEINTLVKQTSGLSDAEVAAHRLLTHAEDAATLPKRIVSNISQRFLKQGTPRSKQGDGTPQVINLGEAETSHQDGVGDDAVPFGAKERNPTPPAQSIGTEEIHLYDANPTAERTRSRSRADTPQCGQAMMHLCSPVKE